MRKVSQEITEAFIAHQPRKASNTETDGKAIFLFGKKIFWRTDGGYAMTLAGWPTPTTRSRLNDILHALGFDWLGFYQEKGEQKFCTLACGGMEIDPGDIIEIDFEGNLK